MGLKDFFSKLFGAKKTDSTPSEDIFQGSDTFSPENQPEESKPSAEVMPQPEAEKPTEEQPLSEPEEETPPADDSDQDNA